MTGSESNPSLAIGVKGTSGYIGFYAANGTSNQAFRIMASGASASGNLIAVQGAAAGSAPSIQAVSGSSGSDTNIDLALTPKGTGAVNAGTQNANFLRLAGNSANNSPELSVAGTDANIPLTFESKGTGAINLASGSRGVNISNGQTVTAITRISAGTGYTSAPSVAISAPTTAGGVQATATSAIFTSGTPTITFGGTGYTVGDVLTVVGGTFTTATRITVNTVSAGVITAATVTTLGSYTIAPTNPASVTGGTGTGATFTMSYAVLPTFTITNAGSGYVEQPTVTFSGGDGSGASAYASVGSGTTVKSLATTMSLSTSAGEVLRLSDNNGTSANYLLGLSGITGVQPQLRSAGETNTNLLLGSNGGGAVRFTTNGGSAVEQARVAHTASAVNFVQVTGAATNGRVTLSAQGSDANIGFVYNTKGAQNHVFQTNSGNVQFVISNRATSANWVQAQGNTAGNPPAFSVEGSDTNIDLAFVPKGTGKVRFGTYTASAGLVIAGYIEVKDAGGTVRRLAVVD
jgi:hypothetical protein